MDTNHIIEISRMSPGQSSEFLASAVAAHYHREQKRKYTGDPYITHCRHVAEIVKEVSPDDAHMAIAAWLHDTLEDTEMKPVTIQLLFGPIVLYYVQDLTHCPEWIGNRAKRKDYDLHRLYEACPEVQTIKLADILDNTWSIATHDPKFALTYLPEIQRLVAALTRGNKTLWDRAAEQLNRLGYPVEVCK